MCTRRRTNSKNNRDNENINNEDDNGNANNIRNGNTNNSTDNNNIDAITDNNKSINSNRNGNSNRKWDGVSNSIRIRIIRRISIDNSIDDSDRINRSSASNSGRASSKCSSRVLTKNSCGSRNTGARRRKGSA